MAKILAFAGSNSSRSINYALVKHTVSMVETHDVQVLNMANMPFPLYSEDHEREQGFSNALVELKDDIQEADGIIMAVNEHNGNPSAYTKNLLDWLSRLDRKFMDGAKVLLMSTSRGKRGAAGSLKTVEALLPRFGAEILATFSLPSFNENFDVENGVTEDSLASQHKEALQQFLSKL